MRWISATIIPVCEQNERVSASAATDDIASYRNACLIKHYHISNYAIHHTSLDTQARWCRLALARRQGAGRRRLMVMPRLAVEWAKNAARAARSGSLIRATRGAVQDSGTTLCRHCLHGGPSLVVHALCASLCILIHPCTSLSILVHPCSSAFIRGFMSQHSPNRTQVGHRGAGYPAIQLGL